jgi:hypothetical protein
MKKQFAHSAFVAQDLIETAKRLAGALAWMCGNSSAPNYPGHIQD